MKSIKEKAEEYGYTNWQSDEYHDGASEGLEFDPIGHTQKTFEAGANNNLWVQLKYFWHNTKREIYYATPWKDAQGDDLPEIDREVVVLIKYNAQRNIHDEEYPTYRVGFGHRPNPDGWDGKDIDTNEVTHYTPKLYDKGGWNAPNIVYWLDARLPYEENKIIKEL